MPNASEGKGTEDTRGRHRAIGAALSLSGTHITDGRDFPTHAVLASSPSSALPSRRMHRLGRAHR